MTGTNSWMPAPWDFVSSRYISYGYTSDVMAPRSGTRAIRLDPGGLFGYAPGYLGYMEIMQSNVIVCPNTLYRYESWQTIRNGAGAGSCQMTLKVNGGAVVTGNAISFTPEMPWVPTTGYYLTGATETSVTLQMRWTCAPTARMTTLIDDVTFTPVS